MGETTETLLVRRGMACYQNADALGRADDVIVESATAI
jgi:hypothetical protein